MPEVVITKFVPHSSATQEYLPGDRVRITYEGTVRTWDQRTKVMSLKLAGSESHYMTHHLLNDSSTTAVLLVPESYKGVTVPEDIRPNWSQPEAVFWRRGVDSAKEA